MSSGNLEAENIEYKYVTMKSLAVSQKIDVNHLKFKPYPNYSYNHFQKAKVIFSTAYSYFYEYISLNLTITFLF